MVSRKELLEYLNDLLKPENYKDSTHNGLQVEGKEEIEQFCFAVDSGMDIFTEAVRKNCDMLAVHHGLIWGGLSKVTGMEKKRLEILLRNNINLYTSHMPLDAHPLFGNNVQLIKALNAAPHNEFGDVGFTGAFPKEIQFSELIQLIRVKINPEAYFLNFSGSPIAQFAVCTGSISLSVLDEAVQKGIGTIITGEGKGESMFFHPAKEYGLNIVFAGHYHTEILGIKALMAEAEKEFGKRLKTALIDMPHK